MVLFHLSEELWTGKDFFKNKVVSAYRLIKDSAQTATISNKIYEKTAKSAKPRSLYERRNEGENAWERLEKTREKSRVLMTLNFLPFFWEHAK